ncbi:type 1 glutamine amidotransferase [Haladaptatus sp. YSMS36]|uniref:type 1 glutamine amidotransferase n=1 Tax=Haladaptatus sp. YSMS36 TaxID=3033384 RepID=UPI0023E8A968|nr:type 1 glutamine amidotransferase [Haladaptatus sp. YSMS36]
MTRLRLALLNASHDATDTKRNFRREVDADLVEFHATEGRLPGTFDFDGFLVTGSRSSVYWDEKWIQPLKDWAKEAIDEGLPALGVCYGHQLLADVLGGTVEGMGEYEIGYREITHHDNTPLFDGIDERFLAFTTHQDAVTELPPGATLTAENDYGVHGFQKDDVFGVQFHPEYDMQTARELTMGKDLTDERRQAVLDGITPENYARAQQAKLVFENFCDYVREVKDIPRAPARQ